MPLNPTRLRTLRQFHQYTQGDLAARVAVSQPAIADYEAGRKEPQSEVVQALSVVLRVDPRFLFQVDDDHFLEPEYNFRKTLSASDRLKKKVIAQASLFGLVVGEIRKHVPTMPKLNIPSFPAGTDAGIEESAERTRLYWGLGVDGPIDSMVDVLEAAGVVLTVADVETAEKVDAFSRYGATSVVVLNSAKGSTSRTFFDTAHEAGHGVLHYRQPPKPLDERENEAQRFAGAFLMPRKPFVRDFWCRGGIDWANLLQMKATWGTSLSAILVRAYQLGVLNAAIYRTAFRELSLRGWRSSEPDEPAAELPQVFSLALQQYEKRTKRSLADFVAETFLTPALFEAVSGSTVGHPRSASIVSLSDRRAISKATKQSPSEVRSRRGARGEP